MKLLSWGLLAVGCLALALPARARLGETENQLNARYGAQLSVKMLPADDSTVALKRVTYSKGGFQINVYLLAGRSVQEEFTKLTGDAFTDDETVALRQANLEDQGWERDANDPTVWNRSDGSMAFSDKDGARYTVRSIVLINTNSKTYKRSHATSTHGF